MIEESRLRRFILLLLPVVLTGSMALVFGCLGSWFGERLGYLLGFVVYWGVWCLAVPFWLLGAQGVRALLRRPSTEVVRGSLLLWGLLLAPLMLSYGYAFPRAVASATTVIILASAALSIVNATCEEILWRGLHIGVAGDSKLRGWIWPAVWFGLWHLAPQLLNPSRNPGGALSFVGVSIALGLCWGWVAFRTGSIRRTIVAHILFDFGGLGARVYFDP
jgi:uncharacterized protein